MYRRTAVLALLMVTAGCAQAQPSSAQPAGLPSPAPSSPAQPSPPQPSPSQPAADSPSIPTNNGQSTPPKTPTDTIKKTTWVVGTVTGTNGPCFGLVTDDGKQYALHSDNGLTLTKGSRMRVNTAPSNLRINCGPGQLVEVVAAEPLS